MRTIVEIGSEFECREDARLIVRKPFVGGFRDEVGREPIKRVGGFWNRHVYDFPSFEPYARRSVEPRLNWRLGFAGLLKERVESEGFSGEVSRRQVLDEVIFSLGAFEWRFYEPHQRLNFFVRDPAVAWRSTVLAFDFFRRSRTIED